MIGSGADQAPRALILAAGRGARLRPLTDTVPKPLVEAAGKPLIHYGLELLRAHGIKDVVINVHHLADAIIESVGNGAELGLRIRFSVEETLLDTGGGIRQAAELLGIRREDPVGRPLVVLNADVVSEIPLGEVLARHTRSGALVTMVLRDDPRAAEYGLFGTDETGRIRHFLGRGLPPEGLRLGMFASVHVLSAEVVGHMPATGAFGSMRDLYPRLFNEGGHFEGVFYDGPWYTADTPADLAATDAALRQTGYCPKPGTPRF